MLEMTMTSSAIKLVLLEWHYVLLHLPNGQPLIPSTWETQNPLPPEMLTKTQWLKLSVEA